MESPKVAIVVLNWNGWQDTIECLGSLFQVSYPNLNIIVVDNGSKDGSVAKIRDYIKSKQKSAEILELGTNLGYAAGNNMGIKQALSDPGVKYVLILNNDTTVDQDFLSKMMEVFSDNPKCGLVGPNILDYATRKYLPGPWPRQLKWMEILMYFSPLKVIFMNLPFTDKHLLKGDKPQKAYVFAGSCLLFKREAIESINGFDEKTFLGWEEWIVSDKLTNLGYELYAAPLSIIYHKVGQGTKKLASADKTIAFLKAEKYVVNYYFRYPLYQKLLLSLVQLAIYSIAAAFNRSFRRAYLQLVKTIFDFRG